MHEFYSLMRLEPRKSFRRYWKKINGAAWNGIRLDPDAGHWNAGVIGLPRDRAAELVDKTLSLTDAIIPAWGDKPHSHTEEMAFSFILGGAGNLREAIDVIGHYWGNKTPWREMIARFFALGRLKGSTIDDGINEFAGINLAAIPLHAQVKLWRRRADRLLDRILPAHRIYRFPGRLPPD